MRDPIDTALLINLVKSTRRLTALLEKLRFKDVDGWGLYKAKKYAEKFLAWKAP